MYILFFICCVSSILRILCRLQSLSFPKFDYVTAAGKIVNYTTLCLMICEEFQMDSYTLISCDFTSLLENRYSSKLYK